MNRETAQVDKINEKEEIINLSNSRKLSRSQKGDLQDSQFRVAAEQVVEISSKLEKSLLEEKESEKNLEDLLNIVYEENENEWEEDVNKKRENQADKTIQKSIEDQTDENYFKKFSPKTRKFIQQRIFYLNDGSSVIRYTRQNDFGTKENKILLSCSDTECKGRAEIELKDLQKKDIRVLEKCSIDSNKHTYNYKRFFIRKIRNFDLGNEEVNYPQIQKMIFREMFLHCFKLEPSHAITLFATKFGIEPKMSEEDVQNLKTSVLDDLRRPLKATAGSNGIEGDKQPSRIVIRSRRFWEAFQTLIESK